MSSSDLLRRCGVSNVSTPLWTVAEDAAGYAAAGFGAIGIWLHKLEQPRLEGGFFMPEKQIPQDVLDAAVAAVRDAGLRVSHVVLAGNYTEDEKRQAAIDHTLHAIDISDAFSADCLIVNPGRLNGLDRAAGIDKAATAISEVLEQRRANVRLALEPVIDWQSDFLNTLGQALEIVEVVDHADLGVYPDTWHLWETGTYDEDMERAGDRIFGFHLNDGRSGDRHREIPGEGEIPLVDMVRTAERVGYSGTYDVEYTTPMAVGATGGTFDVPYEDVLRRIADGTTRILAEAGVKA
jgi:sugar phosphate isomerase/epimerase